MSKLTLHLQKVPDWFGEFIDRCQGNLGYIVGVDTYPNIPGVETLGRTWHYDECTYVGQGAAGADRWINERASIYAANPHVKRWIGPNECVLWNDECVENFNAFHVRYIERMSALGHGTICGQINTGWPRLRKYGDPPPYPEAIAPTLSALWAHGGWLSLHEYWPGLDDPTGNILRYRDTRAALIAAGITQLPDFVITELGIDVQDSSAPQGHWGWTHFTDWPGYFDMLRSYDAELAKDGYIRGASIFTVADDWVTFQINRDQAMPLADYIAQDEPEPPEPPTERARGIDVSQYQGEIDWQKVADSGISFAFIRASAGEFRDNWFEVNYRRATAAGLLVGAYHYLHPTDSGQAGTFARAVAGKDLALGYWADIEANDLTAEKCETFFRYLDAKPELNSRCNIYTSASKFDRYGQPVWAIDRLLWVADWRGYLEPLLPQAWSEWEFWQTTSGGSVPGIVGRVDLDVYAGTLEQLQDAYGNGEETYMEIKVFDAVGNERDWQWVLDEFGPLDLRIADPVEIGGQMQVIRLVEVRERIGPSSCDAHLFDINGQPIEGAGAAWWYSTAPALPTVSPPTSVWEPRGDIGFTNGEGVVGFAMSVDGYYDPAHQIGPYGAWFLTAEHPSDGLFGLGMIAGTDHRHLDVTFQIIAVDDPEPPEPPEPGEDLEAVVAELAGIRSALEELVAWLKRP